MPFQFVPVEGSLECLALSAHHSRSSEANRERPASGEVYIFVISQTWGEADVILPTLFQLKRESPECLILLHFKELSLLDKIEANLILATLMAQVVDFVLVAQDSTGTTISAASVEGKMDALSFNRFTVAARKLKNWTLRIWNDFRDRRWLRATFGKSTLCVLRDYQPEGLFESLVSRALPDTEFVLFQHGTDPLRLKGSLWEEQPENPRWWNGKPRLVHCSTFLLAHTESRDFFRKLLRNVNGREIDFSDVGQPRYDAAWRDRLKSMPQFLNSAEHRDSARYSLKIAFFLTSPVKGRDTDVFLEGMFSVLNKYPEAYLLIKPHPRDDVDRLAEVLKKHSEDRWRITTLHPLQICSLVDVVVSVRSSVIVDALAEGKPVIEFFQYDELTPIYLRDAAGRITYLFRMLDLVTPADTVAELADALEKFLDGTLDWQSQLQRANDFFRFDIEATTRSSSAVKRLTSCL